MGKNNNSYSNEHKMNDGYYDFQGGYISYSPATLTEHYTVKGFNGIDEESKDSESHWC